MSQPGIETKVAFLRDPGSYPDLPPHIDVRESHHSWVFLTNGHAYKLKKPVVTEHVDFRSLAARRRNAEAEVCLNRRLAPDVYLGLVAVGVNRQGHLQLGAGRVVDWLVKMRRLHEERSLAHRMAAGRATRDDALATGRRLGRFYRDVARPVPRTPAAHRRRLARSLTRYRDVLLRPRYRLSRAQVQRIATGALALLHTRAERFARRAREGRIVEGHGDLRPEHVFLEDGVTIIDCLEHDQELRTLDAASDVAFLALECERLGAPGLVPALHDGYTEITGDAPPEVVLRFHRVEHALARAMLAVQRIDDDASRTSRWLAKAGAYLALASSQLDQVDD